VTAIDSLRIGTVPFANVMPLDFYLPEILPNAEFVYGVPSKLAPMLEEGAVDVALLSTIELFRHPEYGRIPDIGICSDGQVGSVCLFTQEEPAKLQSVALDSNSLTSNTLLKILFEEYWQNFPEYVPYTPPVENGLQIADAAISIGDSTFFMKDDSYMSIDLGEIWQTHTEKPFVYATWVTRKGLDPAEIAEPFLEAKKMGMEHLRQLAVVCGQQRDLPPDFIFKYFTKNIIFDVGKRELKGMELFFRKAELIV
jgi:chorismate dehydratase